MLTVKLHALSVSVSTDQKSQSRVMQSISLGTRCYASHDHNSHHNHLLLNAEALSFCKIDPVTHSRFEEYFEKGMTAAGAAEFHSNFLDLDDCDGGSLAVVHADVAVNPKRSTISYWYVKWKEANLGKRHGEGMWAVLELSINPRVV